MSVRSILEIYDVNTGLQQPVKEFDCVVEAPNWLSDGDTILYNSKGRILKYSLSHDTIAVLDTGDCIACNNDHVPSPDNRRLAISCSPDPENVLGSRIYILPIEGGTPREVVGNAPSFLHGWSVNGELVYCAFRPDGKGGNAVDICSVSENGGAEMRLTDGTGYNDGAEFSPDGGYIWLNSTRSGLMQIWRMKRDGSELERMTHIDGNAWFAHISPDGTKVVYLVFRRGDLEPWQHLPDKSVEIRMMNADGSGDRSLFTLFGGQGTINVNSWAPDSARFAFISYR